MGEQSAWEVNLHRKAMKELEKLPKHAVERAWAEIEVLQIDPFAHGTTSVRNAENVYKRRIGDYRVVFHVDRGPRLVTVLRIGNRRDVYRDF